MGVWIREVGVWIWEVGVWGSEVGVCNLACSCLDDVCGVNIGDLGTEV